MPVIALQGLRGGAGTTSLTAAFAWALNTLGEAVIAVDFSSDNQLGMHFNMPGGMPRGWFRAAVDQQPWQHSALRYAPRLDFIPFGRVSDDERMGFASQALDYCRDWPVRLAALRQHYSWVLLDIPAENTPWTRGLLAQADRVISVMVPDGNCHIRLHQQRFLPGTLCLINQLSPLNRTQQDLHQLWLNSMQNLIPLTIHRDEAMAEALLNKQPVGGIPPFKPGGRRDDDFCQLGAA